MKVVFLQDVPNVAHAGEIKEIADGYGRNYLIPKKLAVLADKAANKVLERQQKINAQINAEQSEVAQQLEGKEIILKAQVGAQEKLYGSITHADIAEEIQNTTGITIDKRKIELDEPIRRLGSHEVTIKLARDIAARITVTVTATETATEPEPVTETTTEPEPVTEPEKEKNQGEQ